MWVTISRQSLIHYICYILYAINDVELVHKFIIEGITNALDKVAPLKKFTVSRRDDLYLAKDTLQMMAKRDSATTRPSYRVLRNKVTSMVRRDRLCTNLSKLRKANGDAKTLWSLANQALGKTKHTPLPASLMIEGVQTNGKTEAAEAMNTFYINKINKLRARIPQDPPVLPTRPQPQDRFEFAFANAAKVSRIIKSLGNTAALGNDGIPTKVLKLGVDCLAGPISHLVNRSLADSQVPKAFKEGRIIPVYKGKGKSVADPGSYRPVSLLPALSKVLELVVKEDLDAFLLKSGGLPNSQFGFRSKRSTTAAIATAHGSWLKAMQQGETVAILAFDFSAAFDTVDPSMLIKKLERLGVSGKRESSWFLSYMTGGCQAVDWEGTRSGQMSVKYGVRQGSILGPLLFLTLMADLPTALGITDSCTVGYADDVCLWATGKDLNRLSAELHRLASSFVDFANCNGLALNPDKTQLLLAGSNAAKARQELTVHVGEAVIRPGNALDLLGVSFDSTLSQTPYGTGMAHAAKQRASLIARLGLHLPRGHYLKQLAQGLLLGKLGYAAAAMAPIRLHSGDPVPESVKAIQVAVNDVARTLTGSKRKDHIKVEDLLEQAQLPSYNRMVIRATALETWKAFHSSDGPQGDRNPLGLLIFGSRDDTAPPLKATRAAAAGKIRPSVFKNSMVANGALIWNTSTDLRAASSYGQAVSVAKKLASKSPL